MRILMALGIAAALVASASAALAQRVDTYDKHANRTGYAVVNPTTGRVDFYDKYSNRTGYGTITPPPAQTPLCTPPSAYACQSPQPTPPLPLPSR